MKACNVFVGIMQLELVENVVPHVTSRTRRERRDRAIGKVPAQPAQLPVLGTKFVTPLRNAVGLIDGKKRDRHLLQPSQSVSRAAAAPAKDKAAGTRRPSPDA